MGDIYSELSIIVKLWGDRRVHRAIVTAKQHAERIRDIPPSPALQTPEQQKTLSEAVAFLGKHLEEITALLQEANPDAMKMLREAYEKKSSAWEMMDTLASTATDEFRMLRIQTGPGWIPIGVSWDTQNDAMHAVYQDYQSQKRQINRSSSEFSQLLEQGSLVGAFDLMTPSSLAKKFSDCSQCGKRVIHQNTPRKIRGRLRTR